MPSFDLVRLKIANTYTDFLRIQQPIIGQGDGSFYFFVGKSIKRKFSYHLTGRVKTNDDAIWRANYQPLHAITSRNYFAHYFIKDVYQIPFKENSEVSNRTHDLDLGNMPNSGILISFIIAPKHEDYSGELALKYCENHLPYSFAITAKHSPDLLKKFWQQEENHVWISEKKESPNFNDKEIAEHQIDYYNAIFGYKGFKIMKINEENIWKAVFRVPMRIKPKVSIDQKYSANYSIEVIHTSLSSCKFKVKHARGGHIITSAIELPPMVFDARL